MPCQNVHEGLPNHQRTYSLRRIAAAVIRSMPRVERQAESRTQVEIGPVRRTANTRPDAAPHKAPVRPTSPAQPTTEKADERPALPRSPHRTYDETTASAEQLREYLRLGQRPGSRPRR
jgi:hypothetical protein